MGKAEDEELQAAARAGDLARLRAAVSNGADLEAKDDVRLHRATAQRLELHATDSACAAERVYAAGKRC